METLSNVGVGAIAGIIIGIAWAHFDEIGPKTLTAIFVGLGAAGFLGVAVPEMGGGGSEAAHIVEAVRIWSAIGVAAPVALIAAFGACAVTNAIADH